MLPWFTKYPNQNDEILNLDYVIKQVENLKAAYEAFLAANSLTFADPILWDITKQYSKNTIVLSPEGDAYLSKKVVGAGVQLNNTDYWLEIFNFAEYVRTANSNLTIHIEQNTTRATAAYAVDDWLLWEDVLYKVTSAIAVDDLLTVGTNIVHFTVEDFCRTWQTYMVNTIAQYKADIDASELAYKQQLDGTVLQYKNAIDASELAFTNQLQTYVNTTTGNLQAQLDAAIAGVTVDSEVINARIGFNGLTYSTLGIALRTQAQFAAASDYVTNLKCDALNAHEAKTLNFSDAPIWIDGANVGWDSVNSQIQYNTSNSQHRVLKINCAGIKKISFTSQQTLGIPLYIILHNGALFHDARLASGSTTFEYDYLEMKGIVLDSSYEMYINWYDANTSQDYYNSLDMEIEPLDLPESDYIKANYPQYDLHGQSLNFDGSSLGKTAGFISANGTIITSSDHFYSAIKAKGIKSISVAFTEDRSSSSNIPMIESYIDGVYKMCMSVKQTQGIHTYVVQTPSHSNNDLYYFNWFNVVGEVYPTSVTVTYENEYQRIITPLTWQSIGDSITWLNDNGGVYGRPDYGYQKRIQNLITFGSFNNAGANGATMSDYDTTQIGDYDIYTIELGINDWAASHMTPVGTLSDYKAADGSQNSNYAQCLKRMILNIRSKASHPIIILMTPRRAYDYNDAYPAHSYDPNGDGVYLHEYADLLIDVARFEGFKVVDMYYESGMNDDVLEEYSYDVALHPNDKGMQIYANMLYPVMKELLYNET